MIKLGITGGIGSGKSVVSRLLQVMDFPVYQTDDEAKRLMVEDPIIRRELQALVGESAYHADRSLNRSLLANFIFGYPERLSKVNTIVHPRVKADFLQWGEQHKAHPLVGMECAILYESGFNTLVDKVMLVTAPLELRVQRAMRRDSAQEEQIRKRIQHQWQDADLAAKADFVIHNDGTTPLLPQITKMLRQLQIL